MAIVSHTTIAVYGGANDEGSFMKNGYLLNTKTNSIQEILGQKTDQRFSCISSTNFESQG